jgi:hypothetical protein
MKLLVSLFAGFLAGILAVVAFQGIKDQKRHDQALILTADLDMDQSYRAVFPTLPSTMKGILKPGTHVEIGARKGNVVYLRFHSVVLDSELQRLTRHASQSR